MQRKLFVVLSLVVMLSLTVSAAFAEPNEPTAPETTFVIYGGEYSLGDFVEAAGLTFDPVTDEVLTYWPLEAWLYRPDTVYGADDVVGFDPWFPAMWDLENDYIKPYYESSLRRQEEASQLSDAFGQFYFKFMLPRNAAETWYPCGFPCRWQCNYYNTLDGWTLHSPKLLTYVYPDYRFTDPPKPYWPEPTWVLAHTPLFWPWASSVYPYNLEPEDDPMPFDTVHPLEMWIVEPNGMNAMYIYEMQILGVDWTPTDTQTGDYLEEWPFICGTDFPNMDNLGTPWPWGWEAP
jgi:hypothetical protein